MAEETLTLDQPVSAVPVSKKPLIKKNPGNWSSTQKNLFRFVFLYLFIQCLPVNAEYFSTIISANWSQLYYGDIFNLTRYYPKFFPVYSFYDWLIVGALALIGAVVWRRVEKTEPNFDKLYYSLRVIIRYRLALAVLAYGFIKIFPLQAPYPTLSNLNTNYGDFTAWKLFSISLGAAPVYEIFLGLVEVTAGLLLLFRRTATIGAFILIAYIGNIFLVNLAYEGGEYMYSLYLLTFTLFLLVYDGNRLIRLLSFHEAVEPATYKPTFEDKANRFRIGLKSAFIFVFVVLFGIQTYSGFKNDPHNLPTTPGLSQASGLYNVSEFVLNGRSIPYSLTDPVRWKDVVFEKWSTVSVRSNASVKINTANTEVIARSDDKKLYELAGTSGRHYYHYTTDTVRQVLQWKNKNSGHDDEYTFSYKRPDVNRIILDGKNASGDKIYVVLDRVNKKYLFPLGRTKPLKL